MTAMLERPVPRRPDQPERRSSTGPLAPGLFASAWAVGAGLVCFAFPVLLVWATDSRSGSGALAAVKAIGQLWLLAHGASFEVPGGAVGLTPLGLVLLPLALLHRAGRHSARTAVPGAPVDVVRLVMATAFPYAVMSGVVSALSATQHVRPAPGEAVLASLVVAVAGTTSGVLRESHVVVPLPARLRRSCLAAVAAGAVLVGAGALLAGLSLATHLSRASSLAAAPDPGVVGGIALLALSLACVLNGAVWGAAWLAGPGFAVGVGTSVGPFGTVLGSVPAVPVLAALPASPAPVTMRGLLAVPLLAGVLAGVLVARRLACGPRQAALEAALAGVTTGLLMAALAYVSGGPLGEGRLADVGPSPWQVGLAVALEVGLPAALTAALLRRRSA